MYGELHLKGIHDATESSYKAAEQAHKYGRNHTVGESDFLLPSVLGYW